MWPGLKKMLFDIFQNNMTLTALLLLVAISVFGSLPLLVVEEPDGDGVSVKDVLSP